MNEEIKAILNEIEEELEENACFHELMSADDDCIIFNYSHYWDGYPEFADQIAQETSNLLGEFDRLVKAGFTGFFWVNDYVKNPS